MKPSAWIGRWAVVTLAMWAVVVGARVPAASDPLFVQSAAATGLVFTHVNGATGKYYLPEMMGAGVALFDFDNDGDLDVFLVQSGAIDAGGGAPAACRLFRNDLTVSADGRRTLRFTDVTKQAGISARGSASLSATTTATAGSISTWRTTLRRTSSG